MVRGLLLVLVAAIDVPRTTALQMRVLAPPMPRASYMPSPIAATPCISTLAAPARRAPPVMSAAALLGAPPLLYVIISFYEYAIHRWFQHAEFNTDPGCQRVAKALARSDEPVLLKGLGGGHVEHHAETYDDMSIKFDDRWRESAPAQVLNGDPYRGTAFSWLVYAQLSAGMIPLTVIPMKLLLGIPVLGGVTLALAGTFLHNLVWNVLHPPMHGFGDVPLRDGPPGAWLAPLLRDSWLIKTLVENHMGHHVMGGKANYNVCCPLADQLLGTHCARGEWEQKMRPIPAGARVMAQPAGMEGMPRVPAAAGAAAAASVSATSS